MQIRRTYQTRKIKCPECNNRFQVSFERGETQLNWKCKDCGELIFLRFESHRNGRAGRLLEKVSHAQMDRLRQRARLDRYQLFLAALAVSLLLPYSVRW